MDVVVQCACYRPVGPVSPPPQSACMIVKRHSTKNSKQIFPEKELRSFSPRSYIHVSVSYLYIPRSAYYAPGKWVDRTWEYIDRSQTHACGNRDRGHATPFLGIYKSKFLCSVSCAIYPQGPTKP